MKKFVQAPGKKKKYFITDQGVNNPELATSTLKSRFIIPQQPRHCFSSSIKDTNPGTKIIKKIISAWWLKHKNKLMCNT